MGLVEITRRCVRIIDRPRIQRELDDLRDSR